MIYNTITTTSDRTTQAALSVASTYTRRIRSVRYVCIKQYTLIMRCTTTMNIDCLYLPFAPGLPWNYCGRHTMRARSPREHCAPRFCVGCLRPGTRSTYCRKTTQAVMMHTSVDLCEPEPGCERERQHKIREYPDKKDGVSRPDNNIAQRAHTMPSVYMSIYLSTYLPILRFMSPLPLRTAVEYSIVPSASLRVLRRHSPLQCVLLAVLVHIYHHHHNKSLFLFRVCCCVCCFLRCFLRPSLVTRDQ